MRVLHVISTVAPRYGGPSAAVRGIAEAMTANGAEVTIATTDADGPGRLPVPYGVPVMDRGVEFRFFPRAFTRNWHFSLGLTRWLARSVATFDVIEVHGLFTYTTIPGARLAARAGVPYVVRPLGTLGGWSLAQHRWKKRPYYALIERRHLARAAAIHVTAEAEAREVHALGFGDKTRVIPLGVDVPGPPPPRVSGGAPVRLLFLSRIHRKKGLELLFHALAVVRGRGLAPAVSLTVAGDGDAHYLRALRADVARHGLEDLVHFAGALHGDAKREAFAHADIFVLPSYNENFGIAAAEALAAGVPVILSHDVAIAADVAASGAGLSVPLDTAALAAAIEQLSIDSGLRQRMGVSAWRYANEHLSWTECGRRLMSLFRELVTAREG